MKPVKPFKELIILLFILIVIWLLSWYVNQDILGSGTTDITLHDTYFVLNYSWTASILLPFLWITVLVYVVRCLIGKGKNSLQNLILFISCLMLNINMLYLYQRAVMFVESTSRGWTIYPPLSKLADHIPSERSPIEGGLQVLFFVQIILILLLAIIAALTAKNWNTPKDAI